MTTRVVLVGDYNADVTAHRAIDATLALIGETEGVVIDAQWLPTDAERDRARLSLEAAHGIWCVPASPYASTDGALRAIRHARESGTPFLGTCGGFQHAVLEFARHVRGLAAEHAELAPAAADPLIAPLACSLVEEHGDVVFVPGTRVASLYGTAAAREGYHCRYGLADHKEAALFGSDLVVSARDDRGSVRAIELTTHPFFVATLYQPERAALRHVVHPVPRAFVAASLRHARTHADSRGPAVDFTTLTSAAPDVS